MIQHVKTHYNLIKGNYNYAHDTMNYISVTITSYQLTIFVSHVLQYILIGKTFTFYFSFNSKDNNFAIYTSRILLKSLLFYRLLEYGHEKSYTTTIKNQQAKLLLYAIPYALAENFLN